MCRAAAGGRIAACGPHDTVWNRRGTAVMLAAGIVPLDVEWIYGGNGRIFVVDFGLCEFRRVDPREFLLGRSSQTLGVNYYVPKPGMRGYMEFVQGYWSMLGV